MLWAYAVLGGVGEVQDIDRDEFYSLGGYSLSLTLMNIGCIYCFALITFKLTVDWQVSGMDVP